MSILQDSTLLTRTAFDRPGRATAPTGHESQPRHLQYRSSLSALTGLVRDPRGVVGEWRQAWDGLTPEQRAERERQHARRQVLYAHLREATTYDQWQKAAVELDELEGNNDWKRDVESPDYDPEEIRVRLEQLDAARVSCDVHRMLFLIRTSLTRNLGNMGNIRLYSRSFVGTKDLVEQYINSTLATLDTLLDFSEQGATDGLTPKMTLDQVLAARQAFGRSALLLSGGANFGMNHVGVLKALWEHKLLPRIISGASAGSIVCSVLCTHTDEEIPSILGSFCYGNLAVFEEQGQEGLIWNKLTRFLKYGSLFDISILTRVVREMIGDMTFQEAYNRTRRILNICVSSASLYELPRLLNYITAPNVLIWSAVAASCSVPLVFTAATLMAKDPISGEHVPWNPSPQKWIDGSVDNDLPMTRLAEMFNVNHFIVSQVNPHVVPFIAKEEEAALRADASAATAEGPSGASSWLYTMTMLAKSEAIHRMHTLIDLGVFPTMLTKTVSVLSQKYSGDITILPEISYADFPTMMSNPSVAFMEKSMLRGERATWPKFSRIRNHLAIELALDDAVQRLRTRVVFSASQADLRLGAYPRSRTHQRMRHGASLAVRTGRPDTSGRRPSNSSELEPTGRNSAAARRGRWPTAATHTKAQSVNLPWSSTAAGIAASTGISTGTGSSTTAPQPLADVLSSGAETPTRYTSDSQADLSSSESASPTSPASPAEPDWASSYSVPATPAAYRRLGSYLALSSGTAANKSALPTSKGTSSTVPRQPSPQPPGAAEARYKKLFHHSKSGAGRGRRGGHSGATTDGAAAVETVTERPRGVKRFNALGLEIDLSGARGVVRKGTDDRGAK